MSKLFKNTAFNFGFWSGFLLFALLNLFSCIGDSYSNLADAGGYKIGFPLTIYQADFGYPFHFYFIWSGLIVDIFVGIIFSFVFGLVFEFIHSRIDSRRSPLK